jgi:hypothetical protein
MSGIPANSPITNNYLNMLDNQAAVTYNALGNSGNIDPTGGVDTDALAEAGYKAVKNSKLKTANKEFDMYFWKKIHNEGRRHSEMLMQIA